MTRCGRRKLVWNWMNDWFQMLSLQGLSRKVYLMNCPSNCSEPMELNQSKNRNSYGNQIRAKYL